MSKPCTLSEAFSPPEGYYGQSGLLCALSASESFLDRALGQFTGRSKRTRESFPGPYFFLMLDRSSQLPDLRHVTGIACLFHKDQEPLWEKIGYMHAKVALLLFGRSRTGPAEITRLIVSTGNWTEESSRRQIELVWACDASLARLTEPQSLQMSSDLMAAADFFRSLCHLYHLNPWQDLISNIIDAIPILEKKALPPSRFISTLHISNQLSPLTSDAQPLLKQVCSKIAPASRNFIVCGSGFFEQQRDSDSDLKLIQLLLQQLRKDGKLTDSLRKENQVLVINPEHCGQVSRWLKGAVTGADSWRVLRTTDASRGLHAKFIYLATRRGDSLSNGFCYVGSGNLSMQGFFSAPSLANEGNVEAGVCFDTDVIRSVNSIEQILPWGQEVTHDSIPEQEPEQIDDDSVEITPSPPISCFRQVESGFMKIDWINPRMCTLILGQEPITLSPGQEQIELSDTRAISSYLMLCEGKWKWLIPILDSDGNLPSKPVDIPQWADLMSYLDHFMSHDTENDSDMNDDFDGEEEGAFDVCAGNNASHVIQGEWRNYPAHRAMQLVEKISDRNQHIPSYRLSDWAATLRRLFAESIPQAQKAAWQELKVNFLSVLKREHFAPPDANCVEFQRSKWNELVDDLAQIIGTYEFPAIDKGADQ